MKRLVFRKRLDFADVPSGWNVVRATLDWSGSPLVLLVEGKAESPSFTENPDAWSRWYRTPPKAHHVIYWEGLVPHTLQLEHSQGLSSLHVQRFQDGWLLGDRRGGRTQTYDKHGSLKATCDLGDASEDLQTTADGKIWVSYFDEGVFGNGMGAQGVICFDGTGSSIFKFAEFAQKQSLPMISDCYAMNVAPSGEVWLNYYADFPLVRLRGFSLEQVWPSFYSMGKAFAIRGGETVYMSDRQFMTGRLDRSLDPQVAMAVDEQGHSLVLGEPMRPDAAARGSDMVVNTGTALYELID